AAALWATQKLLPLERNGEFAQNLERCRKAALSLHTKLKSDPNFLTAVEPELDIVVFAPKAVTLAEISARSRKLFDSAAKQNLHLALAELPTSLFAALPSEIAKDRPTITALRSVLMKPEHEPWLGRIWQILQSASV